MNKIFKVVWSKAKQCYVVVSEVAKNHSGKKKIVVASVLAALTVGSEMAVVNVQAVVPEGTVSGGAAAAVGATASATASGSTAIGKDVQVTAAYAQALGYQAKVTAQNGVAIGSSGVSGTWTTAGANDSVAIGTAARALSTNGVAIGRFSKVDGSNHSVALGTGSEATAADSTNTTSYLTNETVNNSGNGVIAVGNKHTATDTGTIVRRIVGVASGTEDYDAANIKQLKALEEKTHTRFLAVSGAANKTETDFPNETWTVGKTDAAAGTTASNLVLKGNYNNEAAAGERAVAVGPWANGIGARSVALGGRAVSNGMQAVALGQATFAYGENTLAVGSYASVNGDNSLAIGTDTFVGKTTRGANNKGVSETGDKTLFGVAIGFNAKTYGTASVTLGKQAQADSLHSVVLGESSLSKAEDNTNTTAYLTNDAVNNTGNGVVSIGNADANVTRRIINVAGGTNDTDAVNVKQLKALETKSVQKFLSINGAANRTKANYPDKTWTIGSPAVTAADGSVTTAATTSTINIMGNYDNEGARGDNSVALGPWANGIGPRSVALGSNAVANGNQSIALGQSTFGHGENTLAVGSYATVNGENSIAIGTDAYVGKASRGAAGKGISATGDKTISAIAIGFGAKAYGNASTVLGLAAQSDVAHSVVLGEGSKAVEADGVNGTSYLTGDAVSNSGNGVVSVGNTSGGSRITRRIINVAGGTNDLDAVNVKQLKAIESASLKTLTINNGGTKTDLTPQDRKLTLTAGNNVTLTTNAATGEVTISATGSVNAINSGNADTLSVNNNNGTVTITPNTASNLSNTADANKLVTAGTVKSALDQKANASDLAAKANASDVTALTNKVTAAEGVANTAKSTADTAKTTAEAAKTAAAEAKAGLAAKIDTTAERHVKEGSYAVQTDGTVTLTKVDGTGTEKTTEAVKITGLATKSSVDTLTTKVGTVEATANAAKAGLADKADKSTVTDLTTKVGTVEATANAAKAGLADKADKSTVIDLTTKVGTVEATANAAKAAAEVANTALADKADKSTVEALTTEVGKKANASDVQNLTTNKLDKTAERHVKQGTYTVAADGSVTLTKVDGEGTEKADEAVVINGLATKASVDNLTTEVGKKANQTAVDELTTKVGTVETTANAAKASAEAANTALADKADKSTVEALSTEVGKKADAATVTAELAKKANAEEVNAELAKKANAEQVNVELAKKANAEEVNAELAKKANAEEVNAELAKKANAEEVNTELAKKANAEQVNAELAKKANAEEVNTELAKKANAEQVNAELAKKANAEEVNAELAKKANTEQVNAELAKKIDTADLQNLTSNKVDKTAERHVKQGTYTVSEDGTVTLTKVDGEGTEKADEAVVINGFATKASVDTLTTEVGKKADAATVTAELAKKANVEEVNAELAKKANAEQVNAELAKKANAEEVNAELAKKANAEQVNAELAKKVDTADLQNLTSNKVDKTAERHVKQGTYTVGEDGSVTLTKVDGEGTEKADEAVVINGLATKASVDNLTTEVGKKANQTAVDDLTTKVGTVETTANAAKAAAEAANTALVDKADKSTVEALTTEVGKKANQTAVDDLTTKVGTVETIANAAKTAAEAANTALVDKADKSTVEALTTEVGKKADAATVNAELAKKANAEEVNAELAKKANVEEVTAELAKKANASDVQNLTTNKLDKTAERHVKQGTYTVGEDGSVTLTKVDGEGTEKADEAVVINGFATKASVDTLTTEVGKKADAATVTAELAKKANAEEVNAELAKKANAEQVNAELAKKANAEEVNAELAKKANAEQVNAELAKKANAEEVNAELAKKANAEEVNAELAKKANAEQVNAELAKKANASDLQNLTTNKLDKASELHVQKGEYEVAEDGTVTLTKVNGNGEVVADEAVKIKGLVTRAQIASLGDLSSNGRDGVNGTSANKGLTAQDGLNGKTLAEKVNALRNGEAGTLVYTDKDGHRLVKAKDGNYYRAEAVLSDGTVKPEVELPEGIKPEKVEKPELRIVSPDGTTTPAKLSNIENGTVAENSKDAVNGGQLFAANKNVADIIGTTLDANGQLVTPTFNVKDKDNKNATSVVQAINLMNEKLDSSNKDLADLSDAGKKVITDLVDVKGDNNITVTPSVDEKTKVKTFIAKLNDTIALGKGDNAVTINGTNGTVIAKNVKANDGVFGAPADAKGVPMAAGNTTTINSDGLSVVSKDAAGNVSKVEIKDGKISGLTGGEYNSYKIDKDGNIVKDSNNNPVVDAKVNVGGNGITITPTEEVKSPVSLTKDGLNNGGNHITNIAPGKDDSDAATVGQVNDAIAQTAGNIGRALEKTSQRVNQVGAHAAALAAMNPLSYDPLRKSQIMAGIGTYSGNQALALGVAHYANENFMFNVGVSMGEGKSMANVGATYRFGTGDDDNIPERYKGGPISSVYVMQDEISALKAENARKDVEYGNKIDMLMERIAMLEAKLK